MGGKNHQPCNQPYRVSSEHEPYLVYSTQMSRALSGALSALEQANIHLEDVLLAELKGGSLRLQPAVEQVQASEAQLEMFLFNVDALRAAMQENGYRDLPTLQAIDLETLGERLAVNSMVEHSAWELVVQKMRSSGGFYNVLAYDKAEGEELKQTTLLLRGRLQGLTKAAEEGRLTQVVEDNEEGNLKIEFAQAYQKWCAFHQVFLASSMLTTELWYQHRGCGTLFTPGKRRTGAA